MFEDLISTNDLFQETLFEYRRCRHGRTKAGRCRKR